MPPPAFKSGAAAAPVPAATKPATAPAPAAAAKPVTAPTPAPVAEAPAATAKKPRTSKYGPKEGTIPTVADADLKALYDTVIGALNGVDLKAIADAYDAMPATAFPGRKEGRAAYMFGNVICRLVQIGDMYAAKPTKPRDSGKKKAVQAIAKRLLGLVGKDGLGDVGEALAKLGINVDELQAE